ncbi:hypothetical protein TIFTF001_006068 [Ficus carica]|uniref:Transmembrane protein n=1 Tax=Ficus carica TaxID=3494 RepID=A0AA88CVL6_FICCA|nr:hypothetical protein TIFTF001_006068 [Ficus carica]
MAKMSLVLAMMMKELMLFLAPFLLILAVQAMNLVSPSLPSTPFDGFTKRHVTIVTTKVPVTKNNGRKTRNWPYSPPPRKRKSKTSFWPFGSSPPPAKRESEHE